MAGIEMRPEGNSARLGRALVFVVFVASCYPDSEHTLPGLSLADILRRLVAPLRRHPLIALVALALLAAGGVAFAWFERDRRTLVRGREALARQDFATAREEFEAYLGRHGDDIEVRLLAAQAARRGGDLNAAEEHLFTAHRGGDVSEASAFEWALLRAQNGDSAGIETYLHEQQHRDPATSALILEAAAQGALKRERTPLALDFLDRLLTLQPDHYQGRLLRGRLWHNLHRYENARTDLAKAVELRPDASEARLLYADGAYQLGFVAEAAEYFERVLRAHDDNTEAMFGLARCRVDEYRLDEASQLLGQLLAREPKNAAASAERDRIKRINRVAHPEGTVSDQVHVVCGACHKYPSPDIFPRSVWRPELRQAYDFLRESSLTAEYPPFEAVARYYEEHAPEDLALPDLAAPKAVGFRREGLTPPNQAPNPGVANVTAARLFDERRDDLIVCDMRFGKVQAYQPYLNPPAWRTLAEVPHPCHAEVVDLDGDGRKDLLVADLGDFAPTDARVGRVVWLRQKQDGTFESITLLENVGRVADVRAADFRGTGKLDLIVAVFGWRGTGEIIFLENHTTDWSKPKFVPHVIDSRHGTIHVPVADLNGDGKPDFVALISQEHETVVAFINEGNGKFRPEPLYTAPHPAWGSSGIELVDLDGDGKVDVLYTNGDSLQKPYILKPYHGVQWLENKGGLKFEPHTLAAMPGAMRAVAADFSGSGRKDIAVVSYLPADDFPQRERMQLPSVLLLKQTAPGKFERQVIETAACDHLTCCVANLDGRSALVAGNFTVNPARKLPEAITIWKSKGERLSRSDFGISGVRRLVAAFRF
jgi:tetratricopeptide (TPR) repeat protein